MVKKIILCLSLMFIFGCTNTKLIPKAQIERPVHSKLAIVSTQYAKEDGLEIIFQNRYGKIVEILWEESKINGEAIVFSETSCKNRYQKMKNDLLIPNIPYKKVIFPLSALKTNGEFASLKYPIKLEIFFKRGEIIDKSIIIIQEGELVEKKVDYMGRIIK